MSKEEIKERNETVLARKLYNAKSEEEAEKILTGYPQAMDVMTVMRMFHEIKQVMQQNIERIEQAYEKATEEGKNSEKQQKENEDIAILRAELSNMKKRNRFLNGHLCRMTHELQETKQRLDVLESNAARRMLVIHNMYTSSKKSEYLKSVEQFFEERIDVKIDDVFLMGNMEPKKVVVTFQSIYDKKEVFRNIEKFKDLKGRNTTSKTFIQHQQMTKNSMSSKS